MRVPPPQVPTGPLENRLIHVVGRQNHGKTALILELVSALRGRGLAVGTIKHTGHEHELDRPGKDSHRHRQAGAAPVAVVTGALSAVYLPGLDPEHPYHTLSGLFQGCDVVLVEGHLEGPGAKLEVWREALGSPPLAASRDDILALVTDDVLPPLASDRGDTRALVEDSVPPPSTVSDSGRPGLSLWPRRDVEGLVDRLITHPVFARRIRLPWAASGPVPGREPG